MSEEGAGSAGYAGAGGAVPSAAEALSWKGFALDDAAGRHVGRVRGAYADAGGDADAGSDAGAGGEVGAWLVVELRRHGLFRRRGGGTIAVPLAECAGAAGRVWTAEPEQALRAAPTIDPARPLLREHEAALCEHYGIPSTSGRHANVHRHPPGAITAHPA